MHPLGNKGSINVSGIFSDSYELAVPWSVTQYSKAISLKKKTKDQ